VGSEARSKQFVPSSMSIPELDQTKFILFICHLSLGAQCVCDALRA
jgi:hypothetical protein